MTEAGHPLLPRQHPPYRCHHPVVIGVLADGLEHLHDLGIGATVQRPLQRGHPDHDGRVDVGERRRRDTRRERRGIQLVVGMENQRHVERAAGQRARALAPQHIQEVGGVSEDRVGLHRCATGGQPPQRRDQRANLRRQTHRLAHRGGRSIVTRVRVMVRQGRHEGAYGVHRVPDRERPHHPHDRLGQRTGPGKLGLQVAQLRPGWQPSMPEQVADFLEARRPREIVDVVSAVRQHAPFPVEVANLRRGRHDPLESGRGGRLRRHRFSPFC